MWDDCWCNVRGEKKEQVNKEWKVGNHFDTTVCDHATTHAKYKSVHNESRIACGRVESTCERRSWKRSHFATEFIGVARTENRSSAPPRWISFPRHYVAIGIRGGTFVLAQHLPRRYARTMPRYPGIQEALASPSRPSLYILE